MTDFILNEDSKRIELFLAGEKLFLPYLLLRDACKCDVCYSETTRERKHMLNTFNTDVYPVDILFRNNQLKVSWSDRHNSTYSIDDIDSLDRFSTHTLKRVSWDCNFQIPEHVLESISSDDEEMKRMLDNFLMFGIVKIIDTPIRKKFVENFAYQIACVREIVFDRVTDVIVKEEAYTQGLATSSELVLHTDCSGYRWPPSVFLFHCLENTVVGGENTYADGLWASRAIKTNHPEDFKFLTNEKVGFRLFSETHDTRVQKQTIELSNTGSVETIRYANWAVNATCNENEYLEGYFSSMKRFGEVVKENSITTRLQPGEMLMVNNHRVLHGREAFQLNSGKRHFQQVYMEIDDIEALWRTL